MTWVKLDDRYRAHIKTLKAGAEGMALDVAGMCFCAEHLTDGFIPDAAVPSLYPVKNVQRVTDALVSVGRWERIEGGYLVHDYLDYNPTAEKVLAEREATKQRVNAWRNTRGNAVTNEVADTSTNAVGTSPPVSRSPSDSSISSSQPVSRPLDEEEVEAAATELTRLRTESFLGRGGSIGNPRAFAAKLHEEAVHEVVVWLLEHPAGTVDLAVEDLSPKEGTPKVDPLEATVAAQEGRIARAKNPCEKCVNGQVETEDGCVPCEACNQQRAG